MAGARVPGPWVGLDKQVRVGRGLLCLAPAQTPGPVGTNPWPEAQPVAHWFFASQMYRFTAHARRLGVLSARYESNGNPGSIGFDRNGGWSYGTYQLATRPGTLAWFLQFLRSHDHRLAEPLDKAGGAKAAKKGDEKFKSAWTTLAKTHGDSFDEAQHEFIKTTHFDVQAKALRDTFALDVSTRSWALQNVVWSMAVQLGGLTKTIFRIVLDKRKANEVTDEELIKGLYAERSRVDVYFVSSDSATQASVLQRFKDEQKDALNMLRDDQ